MRKPVSARRALAAKLQQGDTVKLNARNRVHAMTGRIERVGRLTVIVRWQDDSTNECHKRTLEKETD